MSEHRTVEERASAAQVDIAEQKLHPVKDAFMIRSIIRDRFADVVETDARVTALVEAARDCARTMDNWAENALTQREALEAVSVRNILTAALKPFTEK